MRMWMVSPKILCQNHLLGEHCEIHMLIGTILKRKSINGYIYNNLIEPKSIISRHNELVLEMNYRDINHKSDILYDLDELLSYLPDNIKNYKIDTLKSYNELLSRCSKCKGE